MAEATTDSATAEPPAPKRAPAAVRKAEIRNLEFAPARIEIPAGTVVEWTNRDQVPHTVTARDRSFDSGVIAPGATWRRKFDRPETYEFYCMPHPFMTGVLVVR